MRIAGDNIKLTHKALTINYDDYGPVYAPVVIFIHGFPFNKQMWELQTEELKSNYRVICYDIRGFGLSPAPDKDFSIDTLTLDLIKLMDKLQIRKAALCGLSIGGTIALNAVEKFPDRFNALVLSDTSCRDKGFQTREERLAIIRSIKEKGIRQFAEQSILKYFASRSLLKKSHEIRAARKMIMTTPVTAICETLQSLEQKKEICSHLSEIKIPVLILVGKEDEIATPSDARFIQQQIPGASLRIIEFAGHLPNLENTVDFNFHLKKFMDKVCSKRSLSEPTIIHK